MLDLFLLNDSYQYKQLMSENFWNIEVNVPETISI